MRPADLQSSIEYPDPETAVVYLEVSPEAVVLLQAHFELYEGLGIVRTLSTRERLVCVLTTASLLGACLDAICELASGRDATLRWTTAEKTYETQQINTRRQGLDIKPVQCAAKLGAPDSLEGREIRERYLGYFANAKNTSQI